jgi:predicted HTH transcriptional regulator
MIKACEAAGLLPPLFEEIGARIRVTFFKEPIKKPQITPLEEKLIRYFKEKEELSTQEIANFLGLSRRTVIKKLSELVNKGIVIELSTSSTDPKKRYTLKS